MKHFLLRPLSHFVHKSVWFDYWMFAMLFTGIWYYVDLMFYLLGDYVFNLVVMFANIFVIGNMISGWINLQIYIERVVPKKVSNHA